MKRILVFLLLWTPSLLAQQQNNGKAYLPGTGNAVTAYNVKNYGAIGDAKFSATVSTASSTTLTDATAAAWLPSDVGKLITCVNQSSDVADVTVGHTISTWNSASSIVISGAAADTGSGRYCIWYTQDDTASMLAAYTAAHAPGSSDNITASGSPILSGANSVYCPPGGYAVSGPILTQTGASATSPEQAVGFIGSGKSSCQIYLLPTFSPGSQGLLYWKWASGIVAKDFSVNGLNFLFSTFGSSLGLVGEFQGWGVRWQDFTIEAFANTTSYTTGAGVASAVTLNGCSQPSTGSIEGLSLRGNGNANNAGLSIYQCNAPFTFKNNFIYNFNVTRWISTSGSRGGVDVNAYKNFPLVFINESDLECGVSTGCTVLIGSSIRDTGGWHISNGPGYVYNVDTTSALDLENVTCGAFQSATTAIGCVSAAGSARIYLLDNVLLGQGASQAILNGASTVTVVDEGGNDWNHCISGTCTLITPANASTWSYAGGLVPIIEPSGPLQTNRVQLTADFTDSTSSTPQVITGLSWTFPVNQATNASFHCALLFDQTSAAVSDTFGVGTTTLAPTSLSAQGVSWSGTSGAPTPGNFQNVSATGANTVVTFTPSAITTIWGATIDGAVEMPSSASVGVLNIYVSTTTGTDNLVVKRGSYCTLTP